MTKKVSRGHDFLLQEYTNFSSYLLASTGQKSCFVRIWRAFSEFHEKANKNRFLLAIFRQQKKQVKKHNLKSVSARICVKVSFRQDQCHDK